MATTYVWGVQQLHGYPKKDGKTDVVFTVHWTMTGSRSAVVEGVDKVYVGSVYGSQAVSLDSGVPFTPYTDLTEAQVIGWVQAVMGAEQVAAYEANVADQINNQITYPVVTLPLPWSV